MGRNCGRRVHVRHRSILRLALAKGVIESMQGLSLVRKETYVAQIDALLDVAIAGTKTIELNGVEIAMNKTAKIVGELALAPRFTFMPGEDTRPDIGYGVLGRLGLRWSVTPAVIIDGSINYQTDFGRIADAATLDAIVQWDIRLGAEVFVPWGALACRAVGVFCD